MHFFKFRESRNDDIILFCGKLKRNGNFFCKTFRVNIWIDNLSIESVVFFDAFCNIFWIRKRDIVPLGSNKIPHTKWMKQFSKYPCLHTLSPTDFTTILKSPIPQIAYRRMIINNRFRLGLRKYPMSESRVWHDDDIVSRQIDTFYRSRKKRKRETLIPKYAIYPFGNSRKKLDFFFWKYESDFFFVVHEREYIRLWVHIHQTLENFFSATEFDKQIMNESYFHRERLESIFWSSQCESFTFCKEWFVFFLKRDSVFFLQVCFYQKMNFAFWN